MSTHLYLWRALIVLVGACLPLNAIAQTAQSRPPTAATASTAPAAKAQPEAKPFKPEELEQLAAPIALYPDSLVAQVLMASTYPLEVVQAERWTGENKALKGDALAAE